jgi:hypothetical protein
LTPAQGGKAVAPRPAPRCNKAVADADAAIRLAEHAKRAAGYPDDFSVLDEHVVERGFRLSPMVPLAWPEANCAVLFYVYEETSRVVADLSIYRGPLIARITVKLHDGGVVTTSIEDEGLGLPSGHLSTFGAGSLEPRFQQPVFDVIVGAADPRAHEAFERYRDWLRQERFVATAIYVWHREFFDAVVGDDTQIRDSAKSRSGPWRLQHGENIFEE